MAEDKVAPAAPAEQAVAPTEQAVAPTDTDDCRTTLAWVAEILEALYGRR